MGPGNARVRKRFPHVHKAEAPVRKECAVVFKAGAPVRKEWTPVLQGNARVLKECTLVHKECAAVRGQPPGARRPEVRGDFLQMRCGRERGDKLSPRRAGTDCSSHTRRCARAEIRGLDLKRKERVRSAVALSFHKILHPPHEVVKITGIHFHRNVCGRTAGVRRTGGRWVFIGKTSTKRGGRMLYVFDINRN